MLPGSMSATRLDSGSSEGLSPAAGLSIDATGLRSTVVGPRRMRDVAKSSDSAPVAPLAPKTHPDPNLLRVPASSAPVKAPAARTPGSLTSIATTTTLVVTPPNPVVYPASIHVVGTVTPAPMPSAGFIPAISFYVDGVFRLPAPLDSNGLGETTRASAHRST